MCSSLFVFFTRKQNEKTLVVWLERGACLIGQEQVTWVPSVSALCPLVWCRDHVIFPSLTQRAQTWEILDHHSQTMFWRDQHFPWQLKQLFGFVKQNRQPLRTHPQAQNTWHNLRLCRTPSFSPVLSHTKSPSRCLSISANNLFEKGIVATKVQLYTNSANTVGLLQLSSAAQGCTCT